MYSSDRIPTALEVYLAPRKGRCLIVPFKRAAGGLKEPWIYQDTDEAFQGFTHISTGHFMPYPFYKFLNLQCS